MKTLSKKRPIDIDYWHGAVGVQLEWYNTKEWLVVVDKKLNKVLGTYRFLKKHIKRRIDNNHDRYIFFPQWKSESRYINLVKTINNPEVTEFFQNAKDEEDAFLRYRCFTDWNGLNDSEWYEGSLIDSKILIKWCKENNIDYVFNGIEKPDNYVYDNPDLSNFTWLIDYDEMKRIYKIDT